MLLLSDKSRIFLWRLALLTSLLHSSNVVDLATSGNSTYRTISSIYSQSTHDAFSSMGSSTSFSVRSTSPSATSLRTAGPANTSSSCFFVPSVTGSFTAVDTTFSEGPSTSEDSTAAIVVGSILGGLCILALLIVVFLFLLLRQAPQINADTRFHRKYRPPDSTFVNKHVSFDEEDEHVVEEDDIDAVGVAEGRSSNLTSSNDIALLDRKCSLQEMKRRRDQANAAQNRQEEISTGDNSSILSSDSDLSDSSTVSLQPGTVSIEWPQSESKYSDEYLPMLHSGQSPGSSPHLALGSFPGSGMIYSPLVDNECSV